MWIDAQTAALGFVVSVRERDQFRAWLLWTRLRRVIFGIGQEPVNPEGDRRPDDETSPHQATERALPRETRAGPSSRNSESSEEDEPPNSLVLVEHR